MFKKYDNVYIKHNYYTDARQISGKVGYIADVAQDMYTVKIPHSTGLEAEYILYAHELESLEPKHGQAPVTAKDSTTNTTDIAYIRGEDLINPKDTTYYWKGYTDGLARAIELFTEGRHE